MVAFANVTFAASRGVSAAPRRPRPPKKPHQVQKLRSLRCHTSRFVSDGSFGWSFRMVEGLGRIRSTCAAVAKLLHSSQPNAVEAGGPPRRRSLDDRSDVELVSTNGDAS